MSEQKTEPETNWKAEAGYHKARAEALSRDAGAALTNIETHFKWFPPPRESGALTYGMQLLGSMGGREGPAAHPALGRLVEIQEICEAAIRNASLADCNDTLLAIMSKTSGVPVA